MHFLVYICILSLHLLIHHILTLCFLSLLCFLLILLLPSPPTIAVAAVDDTFTYDTNGTLYRNY